MFSHGIQAISTQQAPTVKKQLFPLLVEFALLETLVPCVGDLLRHGEDQSIQLPFQFPAW
jgi:hypothetical protein